jgi:hypothetical protein
MTQTFRYMLISGVILSAYPVYALQDGDYTYELTPTNTVTITDYAGAGGEVTIPSTIASYSVTSIGDSAFYSCSDLTSVTIPDSVTSIGNSAFRFCPGLTGISIPDSVTSIGDYAFSGRGLTSVTIPDSVTHIGSNAFAASDRLTTATIGNGVTNVPDRMFEECLGLKSVTIGSSVVSIEERPFATWGELQQVYFVGNAPAAEAEVFLGVDSATVYYLPGATGWGTMYAGRPVMLWNPMFTSIVRDGGGISCTVTGTTNIPVAFEVCTNVLTREWTRLYTTNMSGGMLDFVDPSATNQPIRFYRIVGP